MLMHEMIFICNSGNILIIKVSIVIWMDKKILKVYIISKKKQIFYYNFISYNVYNDLIKQNNI